MDRSIIQTDDDKFDQVQTEDRKNESNSTGKSERAGTSKADASSKTVNSGESSRTATSQRNLSGSSHTARESTERCNIGFQMSFKVKITTKIPTEPGASC